MSGDILPDGYEFLNQGTDTLLTQHEADKVIEKVGSEGYIDIIRKVIQRICGSDIDLTTEEIFYITSRAEIIDAINDQSKKVADIITEHGEGTKERSPISIVMALALNEIIIQLADNGELRNVYPSSKRDTYQTQVRYAGRRQSVEKTFSSDSKNRILREILEKRLEFYRKRDGLKHRLEQDAKNEQVKQGLIDKGILVETGKGLGEYKILGLKISSGLRTSSRRLIFSKSIGGKKFSIQRSISEHGWEEALREVLEKVQEVFNLSTHEMHVLNTPIYHKQKLYS